MLLSGPGMLFTHSLYLRRICRIPPWRTVFCKITTKKMTENNRIGVCVFDTDIAVQFSA